MSQKVALTKYKRAVEAIVALYRRAQTKVAETYWEIGRWVVEIEQDGETRAAYGEGILARLSKELTKQCGKGFSVDNLEKMRRFYLEYKNSAAPRKLDWGQYRELLSVEDPVKRAQLEQQAKNTSLSTREVRVLAKTVHLDSTGVTKPLPPLKRPTGLQLSTYKKTGDDIDCGFFVSYPVSRADTTGVTFTDTPSYTYAATVERVVDGDTLCVAVAVGFGITVHEKLRLRGIDCPEMKTPEGKRAKRYVARRLPTGATIIIKSRKTTVDLHGRFVVDVLYKNGSAQHGARNDGADATPEDIIVGGVYLNQELLDSGHATRMKE